MYSHSYIHYTQYDIHVYGYRFIFAVVVIAHHITDDDDDGGGVVAVLFKTHVLYYA